MGSNSGNDNVGFVAKIGRPVVHGDRESPLIRTFQFFVSQTWVGGIREESFQLLPEFEPDLFGKGVERPHDRVGDDDINRQNAFESLSRI